MGNPTKQTGTIQHVCSRSPHLESPQRLKDEIPHFLFSDNKFWRRFDFFF